MMCVNLRNATIPHSVSVIGPHAFDSCTSLGSVTIPYGVTSIGDEAFSGCGGLTLLDILGSVTNMGIATFDGCFSLAHVTLGEGVPSIGYLDFASCNNLLSISIPSSVTNIGDMAFYLCSLLDTVYFRGNAPNFLGDPFSYAFGAKAYYLPGTSGWGSSFAGRATTLWQPQINTKGPDFGVEGNQFGFNVDWASGMSIVVEACTNLANPIWLTLQTNILTNDSVFFSDHQWTNYPSRFYRVRWP